MTASGTVDPAGREVLDGVGQRVARRFPGAAVRWSYTAGAVRKRLAAAGSPIDSPVDALLRMAADGITHVVVGSLHVTAGVEFHELHHAVAEDDRGRRGGLDAVTVSMPLLGSYEDLVRTASAVFAGVPSDRTPEDAVILIGHGNRSHPSDLAYAAAAHVLDRMDGRVFVATVSGRPDLADVVERCVAAGVTRAYLMPFTAVAGHTVRHAVTQSGPEGWAETLGRAGIETAPVMRGLAEYPDVVAVWIDHITESVEHLGCLSAFMGAG